MTEAINLEAMPRDVIGKSSRRLGHEGKVPAVLYGHGRTPTALTLERHDLELLLSHGGAHSHVVTLGIQGEKLPVNVVLKEIQRSPTDGRVRHIDFYAIKMDEVLQAPVPLHYAGEDVSVGVKAGGVLMHNLREVTVEALPKDLPESIVVDISGVEVNQSVHVADLAPPKGVTIVDDPELIVCSITPPKVEVEVAPVPEEIEPEVIGEEKGTEES